MQPIDYLAVGHVSRDIDPADPRGFTTGGTVSFSSQLAAALGQRTGIITSTGADIDAHALFPASQVVSIPAPNSTSFSNIYTPTGRQQIVHSLAGWVAADQLPAEWRTASIAHIGPITDQIDPAFVQAFDPQTLVGITPQGWMREWDDKGRVSPIEIKDPTVLLPHADVVVIGEEDLINDNQLQTMRAMSKLLVMTRSAKGCIVFQSEQVWDVPAPAVSELNATGAGDIFATAFMIQLQRNPSEIVQAAEFANRIASCSVTQPNLTTKIGAILELDH